MKFYFIYIKKDLHLILSSFISFLFFVFVFFQIPHNILFSWFFSVGVGLFIHIIHIHSYTHNLFLLDLQFRKDMLLKIWHLGIFSILS